MGPPETGRQLGKGTLSRRVSHTGELHQLHRSSSCLTAQVGFKYVLSHKLGHEFVRTAQGSLMKGEALRALTACTTLPGQTRGCLRDCVSHRPIERIHAGLSSQR